MNEETPTSEEETAPLNDDKELRLSTKKVIWLAVTVVVAIAAILLINSFTDEDQKENEAVPPSTTPVVITGMGLPDYDFQSSEDPATGEAVPVIEGTSVEGSPLKIKADGQPKVIVVFSHASPISGEFVRGVSEYVDEQGFPSVDVYAISTKVDPEAGNYPPVEWLRSLGWPYLNNTLQDSSENETFVALGAAGAPFFLAVDANNNVVMRAIGNISPEGFIQLAESALVGVPNPSLARTAR